MVPQGEDRPKSERDIAHHARPRRAVTEHEEGTNRGAREDPAGCARRPFGAEESPSPRLFPDAIRKLNELVVAKAGRH